MLTVAWLKKRAQILTLSFLLRLLGAIFSVIMGIGPQIERPMFPKRRGEVQRRPTASGQAEVGIMAIWEVRDIIDVSEFCPG